MARPLRLLIPGGIYHVTTRGNGGEDIYRDDVDRRTFERVLQTVLGRFGWCCLTYCLMPNHFHLLVETPQPNLSRGMQQLKSGYAQLFNTRHHRPGHVFAARFGSVLVQRDAHLLEIFRYVALNPVRAGLCGRPAEWRWGGHSALAGEAKPNGLVDVERALEFFRLPRRDPRAAYREFVASVGEPAEPVAGAALGSEEFLRRHLPATSPSREIAVKQWGDGRPPLAELLRDGSGARIAVAYRTHGYTMAAIASELNCHVSTVSRRLKAHEMREFKI